MLIPIKRIRLSTDRYSTSTPREALSALADAGIGFVYDESTDICTWAPEGNDSCPFVIKSTAPETNFPPGNNTFNIYHKVYNPSTSLISNIMTQNGYASDSNNDILVFDYIKFGNSILFRFNGGNRPAHTIFYGFIEPKSDTDGWIAIQNERTVWPDNVKALKNLGATHGFGSGASSGQVSISPYFDGSYFADNLFVLVIGPNTYAGVPFEVKIGDKMFLTVGGDNNTVPNRVAFDITDYIEEG